MEIPEYPPPGSVLQWWTASFLSLTSNPRIPCNLSLELPVFPAIDMENRFPNSVQWSFMYLKIVLSLVTIPFSRLNNP